MIIHYDKTIYFFLEKTVIAEMPELMTALQEFSEEVQVNKDFFSCEIAVC